MSTNLSLRRPLPVGSAIGITPEKFMGAADQVARPAIPGAAAPAPAPTVAQPAQPPRRAYSSSFTGDGVSAHDRINGQRGTPPKAPSKIGGLAKRLAPIAKAGVATAPLAGFGDYKVQDGIDSSAGGTLGYLVDGEFGKAGESLQKGAVEAGLDTISGLAKTVDFAGGLVGMNPGLAQRFAGSVQEDLGNTVKLDPSLTRQGQNPALGDVSAQKMTSDTSGAEKTAQNASLAGVEIAPGLRKVATQGAPLYTNATSDAADQAALAGRGSVSTIGGGEEGMLRNQRAIELTREIGEMRRGLQDQSVMMGRAAQAPGGVSADLQARLRRAVNSGQRLSQRTMNAATQMAQTEAQQAVQREDTASRAATAQTRLAFDQRKAVQDQANSDRDYSLRAGTQSRAEEQQDFTQRETAAKNVAARYEKMFTGPDGKPDQAKVATYMQGVNAAIGHRMAAAQREIEAGGPDAARAKQELTLLQTKGLAALSEQQLAEIDSLMQTRDRVMAEDGFMPGSANYIDSINPYDFAATGAEQNLFGSDTVSLRGGSKVRAADLKYTEGANALAPDWFKTETRNFDLAKQGLRK